MNHITESTIEKFAIEVLDKQGYQYIYAPSIAPDAVQISLPMGEMEERGI
jgi:seryl-tRNA synthetase